MSSSQSTMDLYYLAIMGVFSLVGGFMTFKFIPQMKDMFIKSHLFGIDLCKRDRERKIAESQGVVAGCVYLGILFCYIPILYYQINHQTSTTLYQYELFVQFLAALLSICCMLFLGFADDVLDLRWRTKLLLPTLASLPLLMVYMLTYGNTTVIVPKPFRDLLGFSVDLSYLYYLYLALLAVFCTNAINIVAGINGIEAGQGLLISSSIVAYNVIELVRNTDHWQSHIFSLNLMLPFMAVTIALLYHNWYPSDVFVGDTYCYFAGMTFSVVGILGHFSKTMLLFFIPQVLNFLYSCPQLFHFVDCPRHRLPTYDSKLDCMVPSKFTIDTQRIGTLGALFIRILRTLRLVSYRQLSESKFECSNLTIINFLLVLWGPLKENQLTICLLVFQFICTLIAFAIRYGLSQVFY